MRTSKKTATPVAGRPKRATPHRLCDRLARYDVKLAKCAAVERYAGNHADLGSALPRICAKVRGAFGSAAELALELYKDPEGDDQYLTLYVRQASYDSDIMDRIEAVSTPFMKRLEKCSGHLLITTDFRRPGD